jgi:hypothetical protein
MTQAISASCAESLHTIGHDLEMRGIKTFIIRCEANLFVVEGGYQSPPAITPVTLHYAVDDVQRLNRKSQERSDHLSVAKNFLSLSQVLWATGIYIKGKESRLLTISNTESTEATPVVKIEYETIQRETVIDYFTGSAIYDLCVSAYKLRGTSHIKDIRYTRFSALQESS